MDAWNKPKSSYKKALAKLDRLAIAPLNRYLEKSGLLDNTIVIITADHGEGLGEHKVVTHTKMLYQPLIKVPLSIFVPGINPRHSHQPIGLIDIKSTLLGLVNSGSAKGQPTEGCDMSSMVMATGRDILHRVFILRASVQIGEIAYPYKLIFEPRNNLAFLFNIETDPLEKHDLWMEQKNRANLMFHDILWRFRKYYPQIKDGKSKVLLP